MGRPSSTHAKREREQQRTEHSKEKLAKRKARKEQNATRPAWEGDPDLVDVIPMPNLEDDPLAR